MERWSELVADAKDTLRRDFLDTDPNDREDELQESIESIVDSELGGSPEQVLFWVNDARLAHVEPQNPPEEKTTYRIGRAVLEEDLRDELEHYLSDLKRYTPVCAGEHYIDDDAPTRECHICGADFCSDPDHGIECVVCHKDTCHDCIAVVRRVNGLPVCDECDDKLTEAEEAEAND